MAASGTQIEVGGYCFACGDVLYLDRIERILGFGHECGECGTLLCMKCCQRDLGRRDHTYWIWPKQIDQASGLVSDRPTKGRRTPMYIRWRLAQDKYHHADLYAATAFYFTPTVQKKES
jgi:hypothetical protein